MRVRSAQKLPSPVRDRPKARATAAAAAMPVAAETNMCEERPTICEKFDIVDSPV